MKSKILKVDLDKANEDVRKDKITYVCGKCGKYYVRKPSFDLHVEKCNGKFTKLQESSSEKDEDIKGAYLLFRKWCLRTKAFPKSKIPSIETAVTKRDFDDFIRVQRFTRSYGINAYTYMEYLVDEKIPSYTWGTNHGILNLNEYAEYANIALDPIYQAKRTRDTIDNWCMKNEGFTVDDFFEILTPSVLVSMIHRGSIKPIPAFLVNKFIETLYDPDTKQLHQYIVLNYNDDLKHWQQLARGAADRSDEITDIVLNGYDHDNRLELSNVG